MLPSEAGRPGKFYLPDAQSPNGGLPSQPGLPVYIRGHDCLRCDGRGLPLRTSNRPEKRKPFYHSKCFSFIPLNSSVRRENHVKKSRSDFALLKSLGTDRKSKMEWPKFVNVIALGLPHENWSFIADLRNLFLDPAPLDTANSSSSRLPGYGECYSHRRSSSYAALCCGAPLREVRCSAASSSSR